MHVRAFAASATLLFVVSGLLPLAAAATTPATPHSVGAIFVDAAGHASGRNLAASLDETQGALSGFTTLASGADVFSRVWIEGFSQAEKIQGVGSSSVSLVGQNARVTLTDTASALLTVEALRQTYAHFEPAPSAHATLRSGGVADVRDDAGHLLGTLVVFGASAEPAIALSQGNLVASLAEGQRAVFLAGADDAMHDALVRALASGRLASVFVSEYTSSFTSAQVDFLASFEARSRSEGSGIATQTSSRAGSSVLLAYDLAYETLPAADASHIAGYADGILAARASSAAEVLTYAQQGAASWFAEAKEGRVRAIVSTPSGAGDHRISLQVSAQASTESQARAESKGDGGNRASGGFSLHDNGKLTGEFSTSIVRRDALQLWGYTELATRSEVFRNVTIQGGASAKSGAQGPRYVAESDDATLTLVDDAFATMLLEARHETRALFVPGSGAREISPAVIAIEPAGHLILLGEGGMSLHTDGSIDATLAPGDRLIFRGAPEPYPSDDALAQAIASGRVGAQALAGLKDGILGVAATAFSPLVSTSADANARGEIAVRYATGAALAQSFVLEARGTSLAAKSAHDITVNVDGAPALAAASLDEAVANGERARSFVESSADGSLRILVNTGAAAGHVAQVMIRSRVADEARAAANTDAFGTFHLYSDGTAVGSFVTLKADAAAGAISGFTLIATGQPVFASLSAGASPFASQGIDGASTLLYESHDARIEISDTTSGFAKIVAKEPTSASFRVAEGLHAELRNAGVATLVTEGGRDVGSLIVTGGGLAQTADGQLLATLGTGAQVIFKAHVGIETELSHAQRVMVSDAIAAGRVAGAVLVQTRATLSGAERNALAAQGAAESVALGAAEQRGYVTAAVTTSYSGDVQMVTAATQSRVDITVSSAQSAGRTILVSLDNRTVSGLASGDAEILFDGKAAEEASSYADVLNADDDAGRAEYFVLAGVAGAQVLVSIPHFSVHTVTLKERAHESNGLYMYATLALGVVVIAESVLLYRRRNK